MPQAALVSPRLQKSMVVNMLLWKGFHVFLKVFQLQSEHLSVLQIAAASGCHMAFNSWLRSFLFRQWMQTGKKPPHVFVLIPLLRIDHIHIHFMFRWRLRNMSTRVHISYQEAKLTSVCKHWFCFPLLVQMDCKQQHTVTVWDILKLRYTIVPTQTRQLATSCLFRALGVSFKCLVTAMVPKTFQCFFKSPPSGA